MAEVCAAYFPHLVELHNYPPANSTKQKIYNFETLNQRVLKKFGYVIPHAVIEDIVNCKQGAVENVLNTLQFKMAKYRERKEGGGGSPPMSARRVSQAAPQQQQHQPHQNHSMVSDAGMGGGGGGSSSSSVSGAKGQHAHIHAGGGAKSSSVDGEILLEKERQIRDLTATVEVLELKVAKLEQLVRLKDNKIQRLMQHQQK